MALRILPLDRAPPPDLEVCRGGHDPEDGEDGPIKARVLAPYVPTSCPGKGLERPIARRIAYAGKVARVYRRLRGDAGRIDSESLEMVMSACDVSLCGIIRRRATGEIGSAAYSIVASLPSYPMVPMRTETYQDLGECGHDDDLEHFHALIEHAYVEKICQVARAWFDAIHGSKSIQFEW
ncbi:hypothetical protein CDV31_017163 [Fusarium ambrosium]|uniref:Uncharacterized protein n=1 Tax=Fusarium ambrosium TaxID=131363 RepID=A0A428RR09_9HYPO|nr:hypothetical protein CDV31_017163 [Fusarium ambrosium]